MTKTFLSFFSFFFALIPIQAQTPTTSAADGQIFWGDPVKIDRSIPYRLIKGSPYHNDNLVMGRIIIEDDTLRKYLRYNSYTDEIEYVENNKVLALADPQQVSAVFVNGIKYTYESYSKNFKVNKGFFVVLVDGNCRLLKREIVTFKPEEPPKTSFHQKTPHRFVKQSPDFYYSCPNQVLEPFTGTGLQLRKLASGDLRSIEDFIRDNKIKFRREKDMVKLFRYLNGS